MNPLLEHGLLTTRRHFFGRSSAGLGTIALASLLDRAFRCGRYGRAGPRRGRRRVSQLRPPSQAGDLPVPVRRASQMDLFDPKPELERLHGTDLPDSIRKGQRLTGMTSRQDRFPVAASRFRFARHGQSGATICELLPYTAQRGRRRSASSSRCTPRRSTTTRPSPFSRPAHSLRAGRASAPGFRTAWGARTRTCRRSWS